MALYDPNQTPETTQLRAHVVARTMLASSASLTEAADRLSLYPGLVTTAHVENLLKLALYLLDLPEGYSQFNMAVFYEENYLGDRGRGYAECGTVACAVGHAPRALSLDPPDIVCPDESGDRVEIEELWLGWSNQHLGSLNAQVWQFCFTGFWTSRDNTPQGAAARIIYAVTCESPRRLNGPDFMGGNSGLRALYQPLLESFG